MLSSRDVNTGYKWNEAMVLTMDVKQTVYLKHHFNILLLRNINNIEKVTGSVTADLHM